MGARATTGSLPRKRPASLPVGRAAGRPLPAPRAWLDFGAQVGKQLGDVRAHGCFVLQKRGTQAGDDDSSFSTDEAQFAGNLASEGVTCDRTEIGRASCR